MRRFAAVVLLAWGTSVAQDQATVVRALAGCGPTTVLFDAKVDNTRHPIAQPETDKAVAYVIENQRAGCFLCDTTTRIGLDGSWVGATKGNSYFSFPVDPGERHLCAALQSGPSSADTTSLANFIVEAGKTYYFRARLTDRNNSGKGGVFWALDLEPINSDQAQFLIASYGFSTAHPKK